MILCVNPGSSSLKYKLFRNDLSFVKGGGFNIGKDGIKNHNDAVLSMIKQIPSGELSSLSKIAVRVVHGGTKFLKPAYVNKEVLLEIEKYNHLAPLHNPSSVETIKILKDKLKQSKVYAVFDTSFFALLPEISATYALPFKISARECIKRFGFHGISHQYVLDKVDPGHKTRLVSIHLGAGCSMAAINKGRPVDTSMGYTPNEGLIMQTRSGDLGPGVVLQLCKTYGIDRAKEIIEKESGLFGVSGITGGILEIIMAAGEKVTNNEEDAKVTASAEQKMRARLALNLFIRRIIKYIGSYAAIMGGIDVIAFTGKVGFNSRYIRNEVTKSLSFLNIKMVELVEPNEELAMAQEIINLGL